MMMKNPTKAKFFIHFPRNVYGFKSKKAQMAKISSLLNLQNTQ